MSSVNGFSRFGFSVLLLGLLLGIVGGWMLAGQSAQAESGLGDGVLPPEAGGQTFYKRVSGTSFHPYSSGTAYNQGHLGCLHRSGNLGNNTFGYSLELPHGALVDYLWLYFYDTSSTNDMFVTISAHNGIGGEEIIDTIYSTSSGGFGTTGSGVFSHVVDNFTESLMIEAVFPNNQNFALQLCGVRVRYQFNISSNFLPAMLNSAVP